MRAVAVLPIVTSWGLRRVRQGSTLDHVSDGHGPTVIDRKWGQTVCPFSFLRQENGYTDFFLESEPDDDPQHGT